MSLTVSSKRSGLVVSTRTSKMIILLCVMASLFAQAYAADPASDLSKLAANANSNFCFKIFKSVTSSAPDENLFFSPFSISSALAMVLAGASGDTRSQMEDALELQAVGSVNQAFSDLFDILNDPTNNFTLDVANRLFVRQDFDILPEFLNTNQEYFRAEAEPLDFAGQAEKSRVYINEWVETKTHQKIKDLLPQNSVDGGTALVLVNAIYFKAMWILPFATKDTTERPFHLSPDKNVQMDMMAINGKRFNYAPLPELGARLLELPYTGGDVSMYILLPDQIDGLATMENKLDLNTLNSAIQSTQSTKVNIVVPKFKLTQKIDLKGILQALGMEDLFDAEKSDLSGISTSNSLFVSGVFHKAYIEVNEEGTEAAASTGVVVGVTSVRDPTPPFVVDSPFIFFIRENTSGSLLFLGRMVAPPEQKGQIGGTSASGRFTSWSPMLIVCFVIYSS